MVNHGEEGIDVHKHAYIAFNKLLVVKLQRQYICYLRFLHQPGSKFRDRPETCPFIKADGQ